MRKLLQIGILPLGYNHANSRQNLFNLQPTAHPLEIIDSPSAMIKMERLNEEVLFFYKRTIELVTGLEMPCQLSSRGQGAQLLE